MIVQDTPPASLPPLPSLPDESEEAAPVNVFAQLFNMFLAAPAPADSAANTEPSMLPAAAPASASEPVHLICAEVIRLDEKSSSIHDLPELPTSALTGFPIPESAVVTPTFAGAELLRRDGKLRSVADLPELPTSEMSVFKIVESAATTPTLGGPVVETSQDDPGVARSQAIGDTQSTDAVDAAPVIMARRPRRDGEPQVNVLAETGWAGTPQMTFTQLPSGVALPAMLDASGQNELNNDTRQSASPLSKSTGLDVSAVALSPMVDMPTALASEMATAVQRHPLELLNQANDDLTTTQQVALPISATTAPSRSDDRDNLKAQSLRSENRASVTLNDSFLANVTAALKQSDGMHRSPFTERPLEIDPEANPATSGLADATTVKRDGEPSQPAMAAASPGDEHSAAKDGWQGQPREGDGQANPSMVAGAAPARLDEPYRGATAAPAWRPMVERLARDIGEHFRVGERQAVLQLDPPELGKVKIELRIEDGQLHVRIAAEGQESHALIEHHLPELHQALRAGQIDFGEVRVTQDEWKGSGDLAQGFSQSPQGRQESPRSFASSAVVDEPMTEHLAQPSRSVDGRVSMWA